MNSPNQHIPVNNIDPGKNVGDGEGSVQVHLEEDLMQTSAKVFAVYGKGGIGKSTGIADRNRRYLQTPTVASWLQVNREAPESCKAHRRPSDREKN